MFDDDIRKLVERDRGTSLADLEADVWRRESVLQSDRRIMHRLTTLQGLLMAVAIVGSAGAGFAASLHLADLRRPVVAMPGEDLAPSTLLLGSPR
jgi:hypothetical protein